MAKGENIYKRKDGRWEGRYPKGRKVNGSIYYGYIYGRTYREVKERLLEKKMTYQLHSSSQGQEFQGSFADWSQFWLEDVKAKQIKPSTYTSYQSKFQVHLLPILGSKQLKTMTTNDIEELMEHLQQSLSLSSVHLIFRMVKNCLEAAKKKGFLAVNPCETVELPPVPKKKATAFSWQEQKQLVTQSQEEDKYLPVLLALEAGLRVGEVCGLKWSDIDFSTSVLHVNRTTQRIYNRQAGKNRTAVIEGSPKTMHSLRTIPLTTTLIQALTQAKKKAKGAYVVTNRATQPMEPRTINYHFAQLKKKLGILKGTFHTLRHSFATRCIAIGGNVAAVSALLGHASIKMTLDTYTSSFLDDQRQVVQKLSKNF